MLAPGRELYRYCKLRVATRDFLEEMAKSVT
jgi:hypothetical protein